MPVLDIIRFKGPLLGVLVALACVACDGAPAALEPGPREAARRPSTALVPKPATSLAPSLAPSLRVDDLLLITVDTLRFDGLGINGNPEARTPRIDALAREGWVFERAYAHNVVTLPSHANILTGLLPYEHGVRDNTGFTLPTSPATAASLLAEEGFATAAFVAAYPLDRAFGLARGFDIYDDEYPQGLDRADVVAERAGDEVVARALQWWRDHAGSRRFLWVHLYDPHAPYQPPIAAADPYLGEVTAVDGYLGPLLDEATSPAAAPALIVLTADHGEALGDHGETSHGLFAYEATLHVPLILWAPGIDPARRSELTAHIDLLPTLLAAAGVESPSGLAGHDLLSEVPAERTVYFESLTPALDRGWAPLRGVIQGDHKLIELPIPELYDLAEDPAESVNRIDSERDVARRLSRALPAESKWPPPRTADVGDAEALRNLGYLGGNAAAKESYSAADDPKNLVHLDAKMHDVIDQFHRGRLDEAQRLALEILAERDDMSAAYYYLAHALLAGERVPEAITVMERARDRGAATTALARQLGLSLTEVGRFEEAIAVLRGLAEDGDGATLNALGVALSEAGNQGEAERVLRGALARDPGDPAAHQNLALVALRREQWTRAAELAGRAVELSDGLSLAWGYLGAANYQLGRRREALAAWQRAVDTDPQNFDALFNITLVAGELGDRQALTRALEQFVRTAPPSRYGPDIAAARERLRTLSR